MNQHRAHAAALISAPLAQVVALSVAALVRAAPAGAQLPAHTSAPPIAACDSAIAAARVDTTRLTVRVHLTRIDGEPLPDTLADRVLAAVVAQLELPTPLRLPLFAAAPVRMRAFAPALDSAGVALRSPVLNGVYAFTLRRDGTFRGARVRLAALAPGVDSAVLHAIAVADTLGGIGEVDRDAVPRGGLELELRLAGGVSVAGPGRPLFTALVGRFPLTDAVPPDTLPTPEYPRDEADAGWEGRVLLQFAVDREGAPSMETVELLQATSIGFAKAALATLPRTRFTPARIGRCPVWQLVRLPIVFRLPDEGS